MRLLILIIFCPFLTQAATPDSVTKSGTIVIGGVSFYYKEIVSDASGFTKTFELYRGDRKILSYVLINKEADCNSESLELGDLETTDSSITCYSYWAWVGGCCGLPYGARKQVFKADNQGNLYLTNAGIYLQPYTHPINEMPAAEAKQYKAKIAAEYNATFLLGKQADDLIAEVKKRLALMIAEETKGWENNRFGFMR